MEPAWLTTLHVPTAIVGVIRKKNPLESSEGAMILSGVALGFVFGLWFGVSL